MDQILQAILDFCVNAGLFIILGLCAIDIAFGIGAALRSGRFDWRAVGQFYKTQVVAYLLPYIVALAVTLLVNGITDLLPIEIAPAAMFAGIVANLVGSIVKNAGGLFKRVATR